MKGIQGLVIAIALGIVGAFFNFVYLSKDRDLETINFIGIKPGVKIARGKPIKRDHLVPIPIPRTQEGHLRKYAYLWSDRNTIVLQGQKAIRHFKGGELLLREDLRTPPTGLNLEGKETVTWVPIDTKSTITSQIVPGVTRVSFYVPKSLNPSAAQSTAEPWAPLGPFDVLSVGTRLGSPAVMRTGGTSTQQRDLLTLRATSKDGRPEPFITELQTYLIRTNNAPLRVMLHAPASK